MNGAKELGGWSLDLRRERDEDLRPEVDTDDEARCMDAGRLSRSKVIRLGVSESDCLGVFASVDGLEGREGVDSEELSNAESAKEMDVCLCMGT